MKDKIDELHDDQLQRLEMKISKFLRTGVLVAGGVMLVGWGWMVSEWHTGFNGNPYVAFETYRALPLSQELTEAFQNHAWPILVSYLGLAILISLPITRVFLTMILFFKQKERVLGAIALFVLIALAISMGLGFEI